MALYFLNRVTRKKSKFSAHLKAFEAEGLDQAQFAIERYLLSDESPGNFKHFNYSAVQALYGKTAGIDRVGIYNLDTYPYKKIEFIERITHLIVETHDKNSFLKCSRLVDEQLGL